MSIDRNKTPVLFSVGSFFAYKIAKRYYKNVHYVWCACEFDSKIQPHTSNPKTICSAFLRAIRSGDRHDELIYNNKAGIIRGADAKLAAGVIDEKQHQEICQLVSLADYEAFFPVVYVIPLEGLTDADKRCYEVPMEKRASDTSQEYIISDLAPSEFTLIDMKSMLGDMFDVVDKKAGD